MTDRPSDKILVIDDDVTQRILVKEFLEEAGYIVRLAEDGKRGLKMAMATSPDLILLDVMLPTLDGYALCAALRQAPEMADTPIILITASREKHVIEKGLAAGADDFVTKPVEWAFLADRVGHVLQRARASRQMTHEAADLARRLKAAEQAGQVKADRNEVQHRQQVAELEGRMARVQQEAGAEVRAMRLALEKEVRVLKEQHIREMAVLRAEADERLNVAREAHATALTGLVAEHEETLKGIREAADAEISEVRMSTSATLQEAAANHEQGLAAAWGFVARLLGAEAHSIHDLADRTTVDKDADREALMRHVKALSGDARRLAATLTDARILAQLMGGETRIKEGRVDLVELVRDGLASVARLAQQRGVALKAEGLERPVAMQADPVRLRYVLLSLLINAIKFNIPGGEVRVRLAAGEDEDPSIAVTDGGVGIAPAALDRLRHGLEHPRDLFLRADGTMGFGLPISMLVARLHGGRVELTSGLGRGTEARLVLPATRRVSEPLEAPQTSASEAKVA